MRMAGLGAELATGGGALAMPAVSVVVPNYNHARYLRQRIDTILAQTYQDFELILLDDCSSDDSRAILQQYASEPRIRLEFNEKNSGSTFKQWNRGVRLARGKYVWIAESDDYADPHFLERLVPALDADPATVISYCRSWRVEGDRVDGFADPLLDPPDLLRWSSDFCANGEELCREYSVLANIVRNASSAVFRKSVYEQIGGADESLRLCGDWKLWASIACCGRVCYTSDPLNYYRFHPGSAWGKSADAALEIAEVLHVVRYVMEKVPPADAVREKSCQRLARGWVLVLLSLRVPMETKRRILRDIRAIDPHVMRRLPPGAWMTARMKVRRHWRDLQSVFEARSPR
jgi:glycosyltransferase involved in cell wall biosynthesis